MRCAVALLVAGLAACAGSDDESHCSGAPDTPIHCGTSGAFDRTLCIDGQDRLFREYVPAAVACDKPAPLIVFLHGLGGNEATGDAARSVADAAGAVLVTPRGTDQGGPFGFGPEGISNSQAFLTAILDALQREFPTDPALTVLTGFSNGGVFASYGIAWYDQRLAAVGVFAAGLLEDFTADFRAAPVKMPVVIRVGDTDTTHQPLADELARQLLASGWPPARVDSRRFAGGHAWSPDMIQATFDLAKSPP
jgi:predicted esterase